MLQGKLRGSLLPPELEGGHIALRALPTGNVRTPRVACKAQLRDRGVTMNAADEDVALFRCKRV